MPPEPTTTPRPASPVTPEPAERDAGLQNLLQLIALRWLAVLGQVVTIVFVHAGLDIRLPIKPMLATVAVLAVFNFASLLRWLMQWPLQRGELFLAMVVDVAVLTVLLYFSGGTSNPFVFLFLVQVILGAVLLASEEVWALVVLTGACFAGLALHALPLALPPSSQPGLQNPYIEGLLICFGLIAALLVVFITRISRNLRARDARLADLRQRAAEEDHIVRMGLLASGAAHELGTPLATLAVILGDWKRLPAFRNDPELLAEAEEMQVQLARCKSIVSGILLSAGEARGESSAATTVREFLDDLVSEWRSTRHVERFEYDDRFGHDVAMVSDSAVRQMIHNVLDNAAEASPKHVKLEVERDAESLLLAVSDDGPGFAAGMLDEFGKPYRSTKGRPGSGLGLFLVVNVARTLGGSVEARNRREGGAVVVLRLPLSAITLSDNQDHGSH
jgi:two-component system sensor histidine kinase RegB